MNTEMKTTHKATLWAWLLLAVLCCASPEATARKARTFSRPAWVGSTTSTIRITKVEFADTATIISFHERYKPGWWIQMSKDSWLLGDDNRKYKALRGEGIVLGEHYVTPPSGEGEFKVLFEPMPRKTRFFDFIEGICKGRLISMACTKREGPAGARGTGAVRDDTRVGAAVFTADTACVRGRIEGYSRSQGYSTMLYGRCEPTTGERVPPRGGYP